MLGVSQEIWLTSEDNEETLNSRISRVKVNKSNLTNDSFRVSLSWYWSNDYQLLTHSHSFLAGRNEWKIKIFPHGFTGGHGFMSMALWLTKCPSGTPQNLILTNKYYNKYYEQEFRCGEIWGIPDYKRNKHIDIEIDFTIIEKIVHNKQETKTMLIKTIDLGNCFSSETDLTDILYSKDRDITLYGDNWELKAHKEVLTARSPVFAAMFDSSMTEPQTDSIQITDIEPHVIRALLNYMYSGKPSLGIDDILPQLYLASSKYQIDKLTSYCEQLLSIGINMQNIFESFKAGDLTRSDAISDACTQFIVDNYDEVTAQEEWKKFEEKNKTICAVVKLLKSRY